MILQEIERELGAAELLLTTDRRGDLPVQLNPLAPLKDDQQGRIGPRSIHQIGPYQPDQLLSGSICIPERFTLGVPTRPLLLIHGLADTNVFSAHTLRLSSALLVAGRPHEVLLLPGVGHKAPSEEIAERLLWHQVRFLQRHLGVDRQP